MKLPKAAEATSVSIFPYTVLAGSSVKSGGWSWQCEAGCEESGLGLGGETAHANHACATAEPVKPDSVMRGETKNVIQDFILGTIIGFQKRGHSPTHTHNFSWRKSV